MPSRPPCGCGRRRPAGGPSRCWPPRSAGCAGPAATSSSRSWARPPPWSPPGWPADWVLAASAVALFGLLPRLAPAAWGPLAVCLLLTLVGAAVQLDQRLLDLSPFTHVPKAPGAAVAAAPLVWLAAVAVALAAGGLVGLCRRDMPATP